MYHYTGNTLSAGDMFACVSLFQSMRLPLILAPTSISAVATFRVNLKRIQNFMRTQRAPQCSMHVFPLSHSPPHPSSKSVHPPNLSICLLSLECSAYTHVHLSLYHTMVYRGVDVRMIQSVCLCVCVCVCVCAVTPDIVVQKQGPSDTNITAMSSNAVLSYYSMPTQSLARNSPASAAMIRSEPSCDCTILPLFCSRACHLCSSRYNTKCSCPILGDRHACQKQKRAKSW